MYLSYDGIIQAVQDQSLPPARRLQVEPFDPSRVRSASLELHIGATMARWKHSPTYVATMAPKALADIDEHDYEITRGLAHGDRFVLKPGEAILVAVDCWLALGHQLVARVDGKSSIGRASQIIHTAGFVEPGFVGILTLEPVNLSPISIVYEVGQPIAQLTVAVLDQPTSRPYGHPEMRSRYQGQHEVTPPRRSADAPAWGSGPAWGRA